MHEFGVTQGAIFVDVKVIQDEITIFLKVLRPLILLKKNPNIMGINTLFAVSIQPKKSRVGLKFKQRR